MGEYYVGSNNLKDVQRKMLEILIEVDRICQKHGIRYILDSGTLLGAVRHKGFIPWDDDMDIAMLREDYDRFCAVANDELPENFVFETMDSRKCYPNIFGKCYNIKTKYVQENTSHLNIRHCIWLDVFPVDNIYPKTKIIQCRKVASLNAIRCLKLHTEPFSAKHLFYLPLLILPIQAINKLANKYMTQNNCQKTEYVWPICKSGIFRSVYKRSMFTDTILADFENYKFPIPREYGKYLCSYYMNPMELPPEEKRQPTHHIISISI